MKHITQIESKRCTGKASKRRQGNPAMDSGIGLDRRVSGTVPAAMPEIALTEMVSTMQRGDEIRLAFLPISESVDIIFL